MNVESKRKSESSNQELVTVDATFVGFVNDFDYLLTTEQCAVVATIEKIESMTWQMVYLTSSQGAQKRGIN